MNDLKLRVWPIVNVVSYSRNARKIPQQAVHKIAASIREFGWRQEIVIDKDNLAPAKKDPKIGKAGVG